MPLSIDPNNNTAGPGDKSLLQANYEYDYPDGLDLKPGSPLHKDLVDKIKRRAQDSHTLMRDRYPQWRQTDRVLQAYVPPSRRHRSDDRSPEEESSAERSAKYNRIVMPYSFANLETMLTYMMTAFLQDPILKYEGVGPDDQLGAMKMQLLIKLHSRRSNMGLALHTMFRDAFSYGIGVVAPKWDRQYGRNMKVKRSGFNILNEVFVLENESRYKGSREVIYEGNALDNVDPYRFLPDPNTAIHEVQNMEYVGWYDRTNLMQILRRERDSKMHFNGKYVRHIDGLSSYLFEDGPNNRPRGNKDNRSAQTNNPVDETYMYIDLVPKDWNLGDGEHPEKWMFSLAGDQVITSAQPLQHIHGDYPVAVAAPDYDGYGTAPVSRMELISDLQTVVDFLYTSHIQNVRKTVNNQLIVDPTKINIHDVMNPEPGKVIRTRRASWNDDPVNSGIKQLDVRDVTSQNISDASFLDNLMQQATGASDSLQGRVPTRTSRISASEIQGARSSGGSRMEKVAHIISMQVMSPIGRQFASNAQQYMSEAHWVKAVGDYANKLREDYGIEPENNRIQVRPTDLVVDYDLLVNDGTIPGNQDAEVMTQLYQTLAQNPKVAQNFSMVRIFKHIFRQLGVKNVDQFEIQEGQSPEVVPDDEVQEQIRQGNLVPANLNGQA